MLRAEIEGSTIRLVAEGPMREELKKLFPEQYAKSSKVMKVKHLTDAFGRPTKDIYIELRGYDPNRKPKPRKKVEVAVEESPVPVATPEVDTAAAIQ